MSIITFSRGSYSHGKEVAEKVAQKLGYECLSREALLRASKEFNISEIKLARALHDAPSFFERFTFSKEKYVAYIRAALLKEVQKDNVVYHGLAGHFLLQGIPHALKVRIIADPQDRVAEEMRREGLSADAALTKLHKDDEQRRRWSLQLFAVDTWDPILYDQVIRISSMTADDAAELIATAVKFPCFQTTPQSQQVLNDLVLASLVKAALVEEYPAAGVSAAAGKVAVALWELPKGERDIPNVRQLASKAAGAEVEVRQPIGTVITTNYCQDKITAWAKVAQPGDIALSRDIERKYGLKFGDLIYLDDEPAPYVFTDTMPTDWKRHADLFSPKCSSAAEYGERKRVLWFVRNG